MNDKQVYVALKAALIKLDFDRMKWAPDIFVFNKENVKALAKQLNAELAALGAP